MYNFATKELNYIIFTKKVEECKRKHIQLPMYRQMLKESIVWPQ